MIDVSRITEPCPFCGEPEQAVSISRDDGLFYAICPTCLARSGPGKSPQGACERWNRRW